MNATGGARIVKRYANRKLYDTVERRFTSPAAVRLLVRDSVDLIVLDHDTGADGTEEVLTRSLRRAEVDELSRKLDARLGDADRERRGRRAGGPGPG